MDHADVRYLESKRTVDDRALSPRVRDRLLELLPSSPHILDAGAGTGSTVARLVGWGITAGTYWGVDVSERVLDYARERRQEALGGAPTAHGFRVQDLDVRFEPGNALTAFEGAEADLVVAQSFLDLVDLDEALAAFERALHPGGLLYAPLTFDGETIFQPDHPADDEIVPAYHDHLEQHPDRDSRAGRHVLDRLREADGTIEAVAASDWIVRPIDGDYPADERYFVECILDFVAEGVDDHPEAEGWLADRRGQLAAGGLTYVAHQYDLLYRTPGD